MRGWVHACNEGKLLGLERAMALSHPVVFAVGTPVTRRPYREHYHISGRFYQKRKTLLEDNAQYPAFLRQFYDRATSRIVAVVTDAERPNNRIVEVEFQFPGGNTSMTQLVVEKDSSGVWKIVDEAGS